MLLILNKNITLGEITNMHCFQQMKGQFVFSLIDDWMKEKKDLTLRKLQEQTPTWYCEDILYGLERLEIIALRERQYVYPVNTGCHLIYLPADKKKYDFYAILMAGGGYGAVCTMVEALPVAAKLNELGIDCFCLNYHTATIESFENGLMPQPLEDVAEALRFIQAHELQFGVQADCYIACGFSAGGHLAAMWGTHHKGARHYGIPNPQFLLLNYPLISLMNINAEMGTVIRKGLLGKHFKDVDMIEYSVNYHVDNLYPRVYMCLAEDDMTVPMQDARDMEEALTEAKVPYHIERAPYGGHGYGLGSATHAKGWVERAIDFGKDPQRFTKGNREGHI